MQGEDTTNIEIKYLLEKNTELLKENNRLLKKIHRNAIWGFWFKVVWFLLLIGLPFVLYFYVLEPCFRAVGSSFEVFSAGMQEIPGWKHFVETLEAIQSRQQ